MRAGGKKQLILASSSPRRRELLEKLGLEFEILAPDVDERALPGEEPEEHVCRLAAEKARAVAAGNPGAVVIAADTVVVLDGEIIGKPVNEEDARRLLGRLAGRTHTVFTGVSVISGQPGSERVKVVRSGVTISALDDREIREYVATGEPLDKAGAYAVQGRGGRFVTTVAGSLTNVIGLPLEETHTLLADAGCPSTLPDERL
jgi:septum formation protein